jgi:hypothetical protein
MTLVILGYHSITPVMVGLSFYDPSQCGVIIQTVVNVGYHSMTPLIKGYHYLWWVYNFSTVVISGLILYYHSHFGFSIMTPVMVGFIIL